MNNGHALVGLLPEYCAQKHRKEVEGIEVQEIYLYRSTPSVMVLLECGVRVTAYLLGRNRRNTVPHKPMKVVLGSVQKYELRKFFVKTPELVAFKCVPTVLSYCSDI